MASIATTWAVFPERVPSLHARQTSSLEALITDRAILPPCRPWWSREGAGRDFRVRCLPMTRNDSRYTYLK